MFEQCERGTREESEANVIVVESVNCIARKKLRRLKQVRRRARGIAEKKAKVMNSAAPFDANVLNRAAIGSSRST